VETWNTSDKVLFNLVSDYEKTMSPREYINEMMLLNPYWHELLGDISHALWTIRYDVLTRTKGILWAYSNVIRGYDKLKSNFSLALSERDSEKLFFLFDDLKTSCLYLSKAISTLESSIKIV